MPSSLRERRRVEERYYTIKDVAARLHVSEKTVRNWIRQRKLRAVRAGHVWRISESALRSFLRENGEEESAGQTDGPPAE
jgi:excisionase family DNA binding protein